MDRYNFNIIEKKWQDIWDKNQTFKTSLDKSRKKFYVLLNAISQGINMEDQLELSQIL